MDTRVIPSGYADLDHLTGGYVLHDMTELSGLPASGKTTMALRAVAAAQSAGLSVLYVDADCALSATVAAQCGVDLDSLAVVRPRDCEECMNMVLPLVESGTIDFLVVDSLQSLVSCEERESFLGTRLRDSLEAVVGKFLDELFDYCVEERRVTCLLVSQMRHWRNREGRWEQTILCNERLRHMACLRLYVSRQEVYGTPGDAGTADNAGRENWTAGSVWPEVTGYTYSVEVKRNNADPSKVGQRCCYLSL